MAFADRINSVRSYMAGNVVSGNVYRVVLEISNHCNLSCLMCPRADMTRKLHSMADDVFERIISGSRNSLEFVSMNGFGEPLIHPRLPHFIEICRKQRVASGISTNCTLLQDERMEQLLLHPPDVLTLAVDGADSATYETVRKGGSFESVQRNVMTYLGRLKEQSKRPFVVLQCIYMTETKSQISHFVSRFKGAGHDAIRIRQLTFSGKGREDDAYANNGCSCFWLWNEPMILSDGRLAPCCQDVNGELSLGNVVDTPLNDLWNGDKARSLRKLHATGRRDSIPLCASCNMYQPSRVLGAGSALLPMDLTNRLVPVIETVLSRMRYSNFSFFR